jgi:hypothetical protein
VKAVSYISVRHSSFMRERIECDAFINKIRAINTASGRNPFSEKGRKDSNQILRGIIASEVTVKRNGPEGIQTTAEEKWRKR